MKPRTLLTLTSTTITTLFHRPRLPLELIHIVLTYLASSLDAKPTLTACTIVHSSWLTFARCLLFRSIRLDACAMPQRPHPRYGAEGVNVPDFDAFIAFMTANPPLARAVRSLEIKGFLCLSWLPHYVSVAAPLVGEVLDEFTVRDVLDVGFDVNGQVCMTQSQKHFAEWTRLEWRTLLQIATRTLPSLCELTLDSLFVDLDLPCMPSYPRSEADAASSHLGVHIPLDKLTLRHVGTTLNTNRALLHLVDAFDASHLTIDALPFKHPSLDPTVSISSVSPSASTSSPPRRSSHQYFRNEKRTTSLEVFGDPDASFVMHVFRAASFSRNITSLDVHINDAADVAALNGLMKTVGRSLRELKIDLHSVCYASKPEVYLDRTSRPSSLSYVREDADYFDCVTNRRHIRRAHPQLHTLPLPLPPLIHALHRHFLRLYRFIQCP